jgi:hypothetical protein
MSFICRANARTHLEYKPWHDTKIQGINEFYLSTPWHDTYTQIKFQSAIADIFIFNGHMYCVSRR